MNTPDILGNFHQRMMPLFTPQAEVLLERIEPNAFNQVSFRYTFSVEAMVSISRIIEDTVLNNYNIADLHVSFQYLSRLLPRQERYERISQSARHLWLYYEPDVPDADLGVLEDSSTTTLIDTGNTPLVQYWYVVAYGPGVNMSLLAQEIPSLSGEERFYEGFYTFEQDVAYQLASILHRSFPDEVVRPIAPEMLSER